MQTFKSFSRKLAGMGLSGPLQAICRSHGVSFAQVYSESKLIEVVRARVACWRWLVEQGRSRAEVARLFGRDSSTIIKALLLERKAA